MERGTIVGSENGLVTNTGNTCEGSGGRGSRGGGDKCVTARGPEVGVADVGVVEANREERTRGWRSKAAPHTWHSRFTGRAPHFCSN
jgi:hypothetical protein